MEDLNNHCVAFCKEFHVEVLKTSRKVGCGVSVRCAYSSQWHCMPAADCMTFP